MNKALEYLDHIEKNDFNMIITTYPPLPAYNGVTKNEMLEEIRQALLKAQENEIVLETLKSKARFYDNNTKCKIEIEADDFNSSKEWEQVKEVLGNDNSR